MDFREDIQILRGIAVILVVLFHLNTRFFENGYLGVDVFFVISGFLMAKLYDRGTKTEFYLKRIDRLLPAYSVTVMAVLIAGYLVTIPVDFNQLYRQAISSGLLIPNFHYWNQNSYFDKSAFNPLLNLWSLGVEAQFYLVVPLVFPFLRRSRVLTALILLLSFCLCVGVQTVSPKTSFFLLPFRVWEFLIGAWIAWFALSPDTGRKGGEITRYALIAVLIVSILVIPLQPESRAIVLGHPGFTALWVCLVTSAIIYFGMPAGFVASILGRTVSRIGDYSYSIYLVHFPIIVLWNYTEFGGTTLGLREAHHFILIPLIILAASFLSYHLLEKSNYLKFRTPLRRAALVVVLFGVAVVSSFVIGTLYSVPERNIFSAWTDRGAYRCGKLFRIVHPTADVCPINAEGSGPKVLLVGNSHADSMKDEFAKVAGKSGVTVYFYVQNDPLMAEALGARKVFQDARHLKIDLVVLHYNNLYGNSAYTASIGKFVKLAAAVSIPVSILAPVPSYSVIVPRAMYEAENFADAPKFSLDLQTHRERTTAFWAFVGKFGKDELSVFDPAGLLCPKGSACLYSDANRKPYYFDTHHLTLTGSALLNPLFNEMLGGLSATNR